jgi:hypothetical protein
VEELLTSETSLKRQLEERKSAEAELIKLNKLLTDDRPKLAQRIIELEEEIRSKEIKSASQLRERSE